MKLKEDALLDGWEETLRGEIEYEIKWTTDSRKFELWCESSLWYSNNVSFDSNYGEIIDSSFLLIYNEIVSIDSL